MTTRDSRIHPPAKRVLSGRFEPGEAQRYVHIPFVMPEGVRQVHMSCHYNDQIDSNPTLAGGNTLDIGLFDERGAESGGPGFRGWSGSEHLAVTIGEEWATPPYRSGPLGPGIWHILLGPYKIGPIGLDWTIDLYFNQNFPPPAEGFSSSPIKSASRQPLSAATAPPRWVKGDLHCHTRYSDGDSWPDEVVAAAAAAELDFLGITDHNAAIPPVPPPPESGLPVLIPGVEVTTYGGHWNAWGAKGPPGEPVWFDFRDPTPDGTQAAVEMALARGAFVSVNHPRPFGPLWTYPEVRGNHAIEVWNGPWERLNSVSLAYWEERLRRGERPIAVGGSDTHRLRTNPADPLRPPRLGEPTTWVRIDGPLSTDAVLAGLRAGRCFVSASPAGPRLHLERTGENVQARVVNAPGAALLLITDRGCVAAESIASADHVWERPYPQGAAYLRAQVLDAYGTMLALSNPVWESV